MLKPRLEKFYENVICEDFILLYNFKNISCLPNLEKITLNSTSGHFSSNPLMVMHCFTAWFLGTSQKCVSTRAQKSIALFNLRKDNLLGLKANCRKKLSFALLDKLLIWVLPRLLSNSVKSNKNDQSRLLESFSKTTEVKQGQPLFSRSFPTFSNESAEEKEKQAQLGDKLNSSKNNRIMRLYFLKTQKKSNKKRGLTKTFFTISHNSARFVPEIAALPLFFDSVFGFAFSCSITHDLKQYNLESYLNTSKNLPIRDRFLSAILLVENKTKQIPHVATLLATRSVARGKCHDRGEIQGEDCHRDHLFLYESQGRVMNGVKTQFISAFQFPISRLLPQK